MPNKTIYVRDLQLWNDLKLRAQAEDVSMAHLIERALRIMLRPELRP